VQGDFATASKVFTSLCSTPSSSQYVGCAALADVAIAEGQLGQARAIVESANVAAHKARNLYGASLTTLMLKIIDQQSNKKEDSELLVPDTSLSDDNRLLTLTSNLCRFAKSSNCFGEIIALLEKRKNRNATPTVESLLAIANSNKAIIDHQPGSAIQFAERAVQFEPSTFAIDNLAEIYESTGHDMQAIAAYKTVLSRSTERIESYDGPALHRLGEIRQELSILNRRNSPPHPGE
jgi:hypothetical protein